MRTLAARTTFSRISGKLRQPSSSYCLPSLKDDLGIDEHQLLLRVLALAQVDHRYALGHAHLRRGQPDALRGVHGLEHVGHQLAQFGVELGHRFAGLLTAPVRDI